MDKLRGWWKNDLVRLRLIILLALVAGGLFSPVVAALTGENLAGLWPNFGTALAGVFVTFILLDLLLGRHMRVEREAREEAQLKADLIRKMGSSVRDVAVPAAEALRARGWLQDGSLREVILFNANLQGAKLALANLQKASLMGANLQKTDLGATNLQRANLERANLKEAYLGDADLPGAALAQADLQGADLWRADLQEADLRQTNLQGADLERANLKGADLREADLKEANLGNSDLKGADLRSADLQGAILEDADLQGAVLAGGAFYESTILPDGTKWAPNTDLTRFTNPKHPNFWRSNDPDSPAYRGDEDE